MRKNVIAGILVAALAAFLAGCSEEQPAELAFQNGDGAVNVNDIIWEEEGTTWSNTTGYSPGNTTESKEVTKLNSEVTCEWNNSGIRVEAVFPSTVSSSLSLNEGESYVATITQ